MKVLDVIRDGSSPRIRCSGKYGIGSEGNLSGRVLKEALEVALLAHGDSVSEVVVDYSDADYEWGDAPNWSTSPAIRRRLAVRFVASKANREALSTLLAKTGFDRFIQVEVSEETQQS